MRGVLPEELTKQISLYIDYLKKQHGLEISVPFADEYSWVLFCGGGELIHHNMHTNPYCLRVKSDGLRHRKCWKCQGMAVRKCMRLKQYTGVCHAGVMEWIYRLCADGSVCGFISVSGYQEPGNTGENPWYCDTLKVGPIPAELLETVIPPLALMLEKLLRMPHEEPGDDLYLRILSYLNEHHASTTVEDLSRKFHYSRSYISHMFRRKSGYTLKSYCNLLKIRDAQMLLSETKMNVTEVALSVGFNNFSYFINVFKEFSGDTPLVWRQKSRQGEHE